MIPQDRTSNIPPPNTQETNLIQNKSRVARWDRRSILAQAFCPVFSSETSPFPGLNEESSSWCYQLRVLLFLLVTWRLASIASIGCSDGWTSQRTERRWCWWRSGDWSARSLSFSTFLFVCRAACKYMLTLMLTFPTFSLCCCCSQSPLQDVPRSIRHQHLWCIACMCVGKRAVL